MATTFIPASSAKLLTLPQNSPLLWWHLLSLDAPTVAVLWSWSFARAFDLRLPAVALFTLGLGTWWVYVADRLLDGWNQHFGRSLRERHFFYARHRRIFLLSLTTAAPPLIYLVLIRITRQVRADDIFLAALGLVYFVLIHSHPPRMHGRKNRSLPMQYSSNRATWLPKELAVGSLFAIATIVPAWSRIQTQTVWMLFCGFIFAGICCWNCIAIQIWEDGCANDLPCGKSMHRFPRWIGFRLSLWAAVLATIAITLAILAPTIGIRLLLLSCALSGLLFFLLHHFRFHLHNRVLRVAADLALLTPLLWIVIAR